MKTATFDETIDFAISREREAVAFYQELQGMAKFASQKELMVEFENMEKGHVTLLQGVKSSQDPSRLSRPVPSDLLLDDFLVAAPPTAGMTYQDILITAIKREKKSSALYTRLRDEAGDAELADIFKRLAAEEENHRHYFEKLYDRDIQKDN